jgi:Kef-type K+ transport system membrane component KefB
VTIATLALVVALGLAGPVLSWSDRLRIPVLVGELAAGVVMGRTGFRVLDPTEPAFVLLADVGFAMIMFMAGTQVPIRDPRLRAGSRIALLRLVVVAAAAAVLGPIVAALFDTGHGALYAVLFASSSAAIVLPIVNSLGLAGAAVTELLPQVSVADAACIVALPLVIDSGHAARAALGAGVVIAASALAYVGLRFAERSGWRHAAHEKSEHRRFALELRVSLLILLLLAALAQQVHVSILLAGFSLGLAVAAVGEPRRLARQLFGLSEGLFGPIFFVWLGATLDLRDLREHAWMILLGVVLAAGALVAHAAAVALRQPMPVATLAAAQLGLPVAATTLGTQLHVLRPGEGAALLLGALLTVAVAGVSGRRIGTAPSQEQPPSG